MSRHQANTRRRLRIWMVANGILLAGITVWVVTVAFGGAGAGAGHASPAGAHPSGSVAPVQVPDRSVFLKPNAPYFGLTTPQSPWSVTELDTVSATAGAHPTLIQFFVKWTEDFRPDAVAMCYKQHALPVLSWEPWAGTSAGENQPKYALRKIAEGQFDTYITKFATAVRDQRWPVVIRFAHEMNGNWYPWSQQRSGNRPGDYVAAWRHIHDVFARVKATNVIWLWSPNILRPVPHVALAPLYPGDAYVDWVGMVGYEAHETQASEVFDPTLNDVRRFTAKPVLITETGAEPGPHKASWTTTLFPWLRRHPDVLGFIWFELSTSDGASADWRFALDPATRKAFHTGIVQSRLATLPPFSYRSP